MTSKMKWALIPSAGLIVSLCVFIYLLGNIWAVACGPFIGGFAGMLSYGLSEKVKVLESFFNWMNRD
jgi:hypothetical protein